MKRLHIHVSVNDLSESIRFYSAMFGDTEPAVQKDDYCKWMLQDPPLNFAISQRGAAPGIDHVGIQVDSDEELAEMNQRFAAADVPVAHQIGAICCYSKSDKAWTVDPQGVAWETFRTLEQVPLFGQSRPESRDNTGACCSPTPSPISFRRP
ncbi:MAG TPA: ArsI/CadI family heavy metal resistance metalloenzyme [Burkholderiales bacterium]|jgi:catechol 2,3-dioxygenase-like lactoylglutathione lyase family enzyme|nr:ArsI/CadI family heavy metal resistance metalloenzyme [Burkholderiales bacterium]